MVIVTLTWYNQYITNLDGETGGMNNGKTVVQDRQSCHRHHRLCHGAHYDDACFSGRSILAFVFGVIFVGMGVYFLRYFERQRRLENMTEEERIAFFKSGEAILVPGEVEKMMQEKHDQGK